MGRQQFTSRNNIGQVLTFQKSGATSSFDPSISFSSGSRRVSWRLDNSSGITQTAGNSITYTGFTSDSGIRDIEMRGNSFSNLNQFTLDNDNIYGNLDLTPLSGLGGTFQVNGNSGLTGITHSPSSQIFTSYNANSCNLTGNLDLTPLSGLGGSFLVLSNPNLTSITHSPSSQIFSAYWSFDCNLTGNLDLTPLSGLAGSFFVQGNSGLTGITHSPSSQIFSSYHASSCNLIGNLDLTPLSGLGGTFQVNGNSGLTGITHSPSSQIFSTYFAFNCNLTGNLDLTPLSGLGGIFQVNGNSGLTGITHSPSSQNFTNYYVYNCNLTGTLDLTPLTKLGGSSSAVTSSLLSLYSNLNLTNLLLPNTTQFFKNNVNTELGGAFGLYSCSLDYVDFTPLSGATLLSGITKGNPRISLRNNGITTTDVNHILVDFSGNATYNPVGWSNVNLNISGTNGAPDSSSGGYNGIAAINFLTGSPYNWTITHS